MSNAKTFLADLYEIDPSLKSHEAELLPLIEQLLVADPAIAPDEEFVAALQVSLRDHAATLGAGGRGRSSLWNNLLYSLGGMATATAAFLIAFSAWQGQPVEQAAQAPANAAARTSDPLFAYQVEETGPGSFGSLTHVANPAGTPPTPSARSQSGGGGGTVGNPAPMMAGGTADAKMIAPWPMVRYTYVYDGELPDLESQVSVYKRDPKANRIPLSGLVSSLNLGMIDAGSFAGMNVQSISFGQDREFGYQLYVDLVNAQVSLNAQWDKWPMSKCTSDECYRNEQVKIGDVLSDARVREIAQAFLTEHGIDLARYGEPVVDNGWRRDYDRTTDKSMVYIPDTQRVIYPLMIADQPVYDQGGLPTGLSVGISVKHERVLDIYGIGDQTYLKSDYVGVTDEAAIKKMIAGLEQWPVGIMLREDGSKPEETAATVTLGEPQLSLATYYDYRDGVSAELLVPSLVFPVKSVTGDNTFFYRQNVVIPLAKQIFDQQGDMGRPMPLEDGPAIMPADAATPPAA